MNPQVLERKSTPVGDGWSREADGTIKMDLVAAMVLYMRMIRGEIPGYAANLCLERGMRFQAFVAKNGIQTVIPPELLLAIRTGSFQRSAENDDL